MLTLIALSNDITVAPQILPSDIREIAHLGFKSVINNRPDGEEVGQPLNGDIEQESEKYGLEYYHMPVISGQITSQQVAMFTDLLEKAPKPIVAFCRTGTRCSMLWSMGSEDFSTLTARVAKAKEKGFDLSRLIQGEFKDGTSPLS
ncbi:TIGR01244 family sulfur transferase [Vibrio cincinnatiensis]|uniref:TIGR01244 family sulfur transferase n=1 Tax=Vibrio cincinnatiensis TaxID=675 RepID=UPI001EE004AD|nr:TIGR01244 family sulfur transferase [Vibrio cincinnatiensis]MCG3730412.1 TIGR01244 family phosphatase [Vibrio cincinnatiensis]